MYVCLMALVPVCGSTRRREPAGDLLAQPVRFLARLDDALRELALEVDEHAGQAEGEGPRPRPIDAGEEFLAAPAVVRDVR